MVRLIASLTCIFWVPVIGAQQVSQADVEQCVKQSGKVDVVAKCVTTAANNAVVTCETRIADELAANRKAVDAKEAKRLEAAGKMEFFLKTLAPALRKDNKVDASFDPASGLLILTQRGYPPTVVLVSSITSVSVHAAKDGTGPYTIGLTCGRPPEAECIAFIEDERKISKSSSLENTITNLSSMAGAEKAAAAFRAILPLYSWR